MRKKKHQRSFVPVAAAHDAPKVTAAAVALGRPDAADRACWTAAVAGARLAAATTVDSVAAEVAYVPEYQPQCLHC